MFILIQILLQFIGKSGHQLQFYRQMQIIRNNISFSTQKYFKDKKFRNLSLTSSKKIGSFNRFSSIFQQEKVKLSYVSTELEKKEKDSSTYSFDLSFQYEENKDLKNLFIKLNQVGVKAKEKNPIVVPWFPRKIEECDLIGVTLLTSDQDKDHFQTFKDQEYQKRRNLIANVSKTYKMGNPIPDVQYSQGQTILWRKLYSRLRQKHENSMTTKFNINSQQLRKALSVDKKIPQLRQINDYLKDKTGIVMKPTHGILSQRQFLNCFAFKVFCCTQYVRHGANPDYSPQPDLVHQILGHIPLFIDKHVAELSQQIGLLSLGASDEEIAHLGALYMFTLQFGVVKQANKMLGYGAGIASSVGQIQHMLSQKAKFKKLEPLYDRTQPYPIHDVQPLFRFTESFEDSLKAFQAYGRTVVKPMKTVYNEKDKKIQYDRHIEGVYTEDKGPKF